MYFSSLVPIVLFALTANAAPSYLIDRRATGFAHQNGLDAQAENNGFRSLNPDSQCMDGSIACVNNQFAQCVGNKFILTACGGDLICAALPLVNSPGTSTTCTTTADRDARIQAALGNSPSTSSSTNSKMGNSATSSPTRSSTSSKSKDVPSAAGSSSPSKADSALQSSTTLDPSVIAKGFTQNGQSANGSEPGQVPSLTSSNNFINFCATVPNLPITNGKQIKTGSCNPAPMGVIAATTRMPTSKFVNPPNLGKVKANTNFTITMAIKNLETGNFVNAQSNYYSAPQQVNKQGDIIGHSHFVIERLESLQQTSLLDNTKFVFFKGVNTPADQNGQLHVSVSGGLPKGTYRLASINAAANHQPVLVAVAQHGSLDDMVYFTVE